MKKLVLFAALLLAANGMAQSSDAYFTSYPTLTPDARTVIFSYESDLWKADLSTGSAMRLTAMQGTETRPRVSPDGKWIAFSSNENGNTDVYVMPVAGGPVRQLTYHSSYDLVEGWSWDSQSIYFESGVQNSGTTYAIDLKGGTPRRLFRHYFNRIHNVAEAPNGELFFNDTWESGSQAMRKGYQGEYNPDIQSYNLKTKEHKRYTDYRGKDMWATVDRNGKIYFVSDETNGQYNLYTFEDGKKTPLTSFKESIKRPQVSADGSKVVFEKDYQLWQYDVASRAAQPLRLSLVQNSTLPKAQEFTTRDKITAFDVAPDNKKLAFVSRGELFVSDHEGKYVKQLPTRTDARVLEVKWLADSISLIYSQTVGGYPNWFTIRADGKGGEKQLTTDAQSNRNLSLNKKRTLGVYLSGRNEVRIIDLKTLQSKTVLKEELWGIQNDVPSFSPNGEYLLFTAYRDFERDIFIHHIKNNTTLNLTQTGISEVEPTWSPDGKYLFFACDRMNPSYPFGMQSPKVYRMALTKLDDAYRSEKFEELFKKESPIAEGTTNDKDKKEDGKKKGKSTKIEEKKPEEAPIKPIALDLEDILDRMEQVSPSFGAQGSPLVIQRDNKTFVFYISDHDKGREGLWRTTYEPFESPKTEKVEDGVGGFEVAQADDKYYLLINGTIRKFNYEGCRAEPIYINYTFQRNLAGEFNQMFHEAWAGVEENFYSETFHGTNWKAIRDRYATFLPHLTNRDDFRTLFNDMLGELNASHLGLYSNGPEEKVYYKNSTLETGILFEEEHPYTVHRIIKRSAADKAGKKILPGDQLTHVNGVAVESQQNRDLYFTKPSLEQEVELTLRRKGADTSYTVRIHPQASLGSNLYDEWIDWNQKYVDDKSKKRIAYVHMKNMGQQEYERFVVDMTRDWYKKDALILDLRYNTGGNVHDLVLNFLSQRPYLQWKYREGALTPQPNFGVAAKPIVLLINEQSLSDAEMTAAGFKQLKLGKVIGTETYRWIIFTSGKGLVDGSFYRLPSWGCFTLDGKNLEKEGVTPDIYVKQTFTDRLNDLDPQLDKAIEELTKAL
ncbi:S41 family peptidase [Telluribacter sp. SYSU D00476]|uniref:S41 family peptidase n=1 Tax=Telluribacter sp. SYSU D00476 TaxID=2811430 RepID=UPI001FF321EB|nr:S41 family peptidase [Telluribacter sp. SYSU D00476]